MAIIIIINSIILSILSLITLLFALNCRNLSTESEKCCVGCPRDTAKYYSIDTAYDRCGECCINPKISFINKIFEKGLTLADGVTCESLGYSVYETTETHGLKYVFTATLDKYKKPE